MVVRVVRTLAVSIELRKTGGVRIQGDTPMNRPITLAICISLLFCSLLSAQEKDRTAQLKQLLKRFPAADTNKDGLLTEAEVKAFRTRQLRRHP